MPSLDPQTAAGTLVAVQFALRVVIDWPNVSRVLDGLEQATLSHIWWKVDGDRSRLHDVHDVARQHSVELRESLLGAGLVIAQRHIVDVENHIKKLSTAYAELRGHRAIEFSKKELMTVPGFLLKNAPHTRIEFINAFANLFKHEAEWTDWDNPTGHGKKTIPIVKSAGAKMLGPNLIMGMHSIVPRQKEPLAAMGKLLERWSKAAEWHAIKKLRIPDDRLRMRRTVADIVKRSARQPDK